jgi:hypothetical protein
MSLTEHVEQALTRLEHAERAIRDCREKQATLENVHEWLGHVSDFVLALSEVHELDREALDSGLHQITERIGLERLSSHRPRAGATPRA